MNRDQVVLTNLIGLKLSEGTLGPAQASMWRASQARRGRWRRERIATMGRHLSKHTLMGVCTGIHPLAPLSWPQFPAY